MLPFGLSPLGVGLMLTIIVLVILYLVVLIKLKPSTEGKRITKPDLLKQKFKESRSTKRESNAILPGKSQEGPIERPEPVSPYNIKTKKAETSQEARPSRCQYHYGYLREHPKNTPIPNECLTCTKIMECLLGGE